MSHPPIPGPRSLRPKPRTRTRRTPLRPSHCRPPSPTMTDADRGFLAGPRIVNRVLTHVVDLFVEVDQPRGVATSPNETRISWSEGGSAVAPPILISKSVSF